MDDILKALSKLSPKDYAIVGVTSAAVGVLAYSVFNQPSKPKKKKSIEKAQPAVAEKTAEPQKTIHPILELASKLSVSIGPGESLAEAADRATKLFESGQILEGFRLAELVLERDATILPALVLRTKIYQSLFFPASTTAQECKSTLSLISKKISQSPKSDDLIDLMFYTAEVKRVLGDSDPSRYDQAIKDLTMILNKIPDHLKARCSLAECLRQKEQYEDALREINRALEIDPQYLRCKYFRARILFFMDRPEEALKDLNEILEQNPRDTASLTLRGFVKKNAEDGSSVETLQSAIADFTAALDVNPAAINSLMLRSLCYTKLGEKEPALRDATRIIELQPNSASGYTQRSEMYLEQNKVQEALEDAAKAVQMEPENPQAYLLRASAYLAMSPAQPTKAITDLTTILTKDPTAVGPRYLRAQLLRDREDFQGAINDSTLLLKNPKLSRRMLPIVLALRAQSSMAVQDIETCLADSMALHKLEPTNNQAILLIGTVFTQLMDFEQGIEWFKKGVANDPSNITFPRLIQTLEDALAQAKYEGAQSEHQPRRSGGVRIQEIDETEVAESQ